VVTIVKDTKEGAVTHHGSAVVHVVGVMVSMSTVVHDAGGAGKGPLFDRTSADSALHGLAVEGRHVEESVGGKALEQRSARIGEVIKPGLKILFLEIFNEIKCFIVNSGLNI
jgi:hypothetical protein